MDLRFTPLIRRKIPPRDTPETEVGSVSDLPGHTRLPVATNPLLATKTGSRAATGFCELRERANPDAFKQGFALVYRVFELEQS